MPPRPATSSSPPTRLPLVVLHHVLPRGSHYDLLLANPLDPKGLLWAGRISRPPARWATMRRFILTPLPPHRRRYLRFEGPLAPKTGPLQGPFRGPFRGRGQSRGRVKRVDRGWCIATIWSPRRFGLQIHLTGFTGALEGSWRASPRPRWLVRPRPGA